MSTGHEFMNHDELNLVDRGRLRTTSAQEGVTEVTERRPFATFQSDETTSFSEKQVVEEFFEFLPYESPQKDPREAFCTKLRKTRLGLDQG